MPWLNHIRIGTTCHYIEDIDNIIMKGASENAKLFIACAFGIQRADSFTPFIY